MAFEVPVEADRVDNLNFFSVVSRAPVFGTLLWFLRAKDEEEDIALCKPQLDDDLPSTSSSSNKSNMKRSRGLKKAAPSLIGSDISDIGEVRESFEAMQVDHSTTTKPYFGRPKKELSWSDESGRELAQYVDESIHTLHQPKPATEKPIRSAMSRSRSVRSNANRLESSAQPEPKFLPSHSSYNTNSNTFKQPHQHNLVEPFSSGTSGIESPQWGFFTNLTPPTPEMYYSRPHKTRKAEMTSEQARAGPSQAPPGTSQFGPNPNPVFEGLQDRNKGAPMAWPGVPL